MSSILPKIENLSQISEFHLFYANALLKLMVETLLSQDNFEIGTYSDQEGEGSIIACDADEFENIRADLKYSRYEFIISIADNTEEYEGSKFSYKLIEESGLLSIIPDKIKDAMRLVATENVPITYTP